MTSLDDFIDKWQLNEISQKYLSELSPASQDDLMATFAPRDTSRDVNGLFISFVKSRKGAKMERPAVGEPQPHHIDFFEKWNLTEAAQEALMRLPSDVQADIIVKFQPKDVSRDCNGLFLAFIRSRAGSMGAGGGLRASPLQALSTQRVGVPVSVPRARSPVPQISQVVVNQFINTYNLNEISENFLMSIPGHLQQDIMEKFSPRDTERDMNGVFLAYAKSRMSRDRSDIGVGLGGGLMNPTLGGGAPLHQRHVIIPQAAPAPFISRNDLARKWNLNLQSLAVFDSLNTDVQNRVAREFSPRDTSRDANKCFQVFCRSRAAIQFVDRWALNEESCKLFSSMEPDIQQLLMTTFSPRDTSRDVNAVFQAYVKSRQHLASEGGRGVKRELDEIPAFVQRWQLKGENADFLNGCDPEIAKEIMSKFNPRDTSRDCNAVFAKFAVTLASKLQGGDP